MTGLGGSGGRVLDFWGRFHRQTERQADGRAETQADRKTWASWTGPVRELGWMPASSLLLLHTDDSGSYS